MNEDPRSEAAARFLLAEREARRDFAPIPDACAPRDVAEACLAQSAFQRLASTALGDPVGWKVALTTPVMQQMVGFDEPVPGAVFGRTVHDSGVGVDIDAFHHLGIECELALRLARPLRAADAPHDLDSAADAVGVVMAAFELVDDRHVDYATFAPNVLSFIADNAWNAGAVLGAPRHDWQDLDRPALVGRLLVDGVEAGQGRGGDVMGDPLIALAWLANALARRGLDLDEGALVMTGSIIATRFVQSGESLEFQLGDLDPVRVHIR